MGHIAATKDADAPMLNQLREDETLDRIMTLLEKADDKTDFEAHDELRKAGILVMGVFRYIKALHDGSLNNG